MLLDIEPVQANGAFIPNYGTPFSYAQPYPSMYPFRYY